MANAMTLLICALFCSAIPAYAQEKPTVEIVSPGDGISAFPVSPESLQAVMTAKFGARAATGLAGCKTEDLLKNAIKDLKADCGAWVKDQKSSPKERFLSSACEESCDDCAMGLRRCTVTGTIHYNTR